MPGVYRREFLVGAGLTGLATVAGCLGEASQGDATASVAELPPPVRGDPDATVTVAVFEDFSCPHCATFNQEVFPKLRATYLEPGTVRYEHHDFPIPVDDWSWPVASAARAVQDSQGDEAFFAYAERLYANQDGYSFDLLAELADAVGADPEAVRRAAAEETYRPVVSADREMGRDRGVSSTPTAIVNGSSLSGPSFDELRQAIEAER